MSWQVVVGRLLGREPGPSLLISGFTALYWFWPRSGIHQIVHHLAGRYYGVAYGASARELLVVSRPDQDQDDALLQVPAAGGQTSRRWPLASRDTHQAVRDGRRLYVTDTHRGRVLEYELPAVRLTRSFAPFTHEDHINSLRVFEGHLYVLANRSGPSQLIQLCLERGEIVQVYDAVGRGAHDIVPWGESFLVLDSLSGGLLAIDRQTKRSRMLWSQPQTFTKGLSVHDDIAYFGISSPVAREQRYHVACEVVAFDLRRGREMARYPMPVPGLINAITTPAQLAKEQVGAPPAPAGARKPTVVAVVARAARLRIAIVATPRTGTTWLALLLERLLGLTKVGWHEVGDWHQLPPRCVLQFHTRPTPEVTAGLRDHDFRTVLTVARHPLDVLVSVLHFCQRNAETKRWLEGEGGDESAIRGATPRSDVFREWAAGPRAAALLGVTPSWWNRDNVLSLRYESLVAAPAEELSRVAATIDEPLGAGAIADAVSATSLDHLRPTAPNRHFWTGQPNHWRRLLTISDAAPLVAAHEQVFDALGYQADADPSVTGTQADRAWVELVGPELLDDVERYTREHHRRTEAEAELRTARRDIATLQQAVEGNHAACQQLQRTYDLDIATLKRAVDEREERIRDLLAKQSRSSGNVSEAAPTGGVG